MREIIGKELKELRAKHNISIKELANILGINERSMVKYENGTLAITMERLDSILDYYHIEKEYFYDKICAEDQKQCKEVC